MLSYKQLYYKFLFLLLYFKINGVYDGMLIGSIKSDWINCFI